MHYDPASYEVTVASSALEFLAWATVPFATWLITRMRPSPVAAWCCAFAAATAFGQLLVCVTPWFDLTWMRFRAGWHLVRVFTGIQAAWHIVLVARNRSAVSLYDRTMREAIQAESDQAFADTAPAAAGVMASDGSLSAVNAALTDLLGVRPVEVLGVNLLKMLRGPARERARIRHSWIEFAADRLPAVIEELEWIRPSDHLRMRLEIRLKKVGKRRVLWVDDLTILRGD